jgi:hypothetical protein
MANVPTNYPVGSSDEEISQVITELSSEILVGGANINSVLQFTPLITVGQSELTKREISRMVSAINDVETSVDYVRLANEKVRIATEELQEAVKLVHDENRKTTKATNSLTKVVSDVREITSDAVKSSKEAGKVSRLLAVISLLVAAVSVGLTIFFAVHSESASNSLMNQQLQQLRSQNSKLESIRSELQAYTKK